MADVGESDPCAASYDDAHTKLRIASVFVILVTSVFGTFAPLVLRRSSWCPTFIFDFAKFFGSGVIIATAFIHLLAPAFDELGSECLSGGWTEYDWAPAIAMIAVYAIFFAEVAAFRIGSKKLAKLGVTYNTHNDAEAAHGHSHDHSAAGAAVVAPVGQNDYPADGKAPYGPGLSPTNEKLPDSSSVDSDSINIDYDISTSEGAAQLVAVAVLEFGVVLHSIIIGLTLAVTDEFTTLFVVIIFHQMFEGLGLGSRLSQLRLPHNLRFAPYIAGAVYSIMTPLGIAIGLGVRASFNGNGAAFNATSGVLDAFSAGILLYTGLVELLGHEILLNPRMMKASNGKMAYAFICICAGSGLMALLGKWA